MKSLNPSKTSRTATEELHKPNSQPADFPVLDPDRGQLFGHLANQVTHKVGPLFAIGSFLVPVLLIIAYVCLFPGDLDNAPERTSLSAHHSKEGPIHIKARVRMVAATNFTAVSPTADLQSIEIWTRSEPSTLWLVGKGGCETISDGFVVFTTQMNQYREPVTDQQYLPTFHEGGFLNTMLWREMLFLSEVNRAQAHQNPPIYSRWQDSSGHSMITMTILAQDSTGPEAGPILPAKWLSTRFTRQFTFDEDAQLLTGLKVTARVDGTDVIVFETEFIDHNAPEEAFERIDNRLKHLTQSLDPVQELH